jgi:aminoglycoside phosphotransferase (APT) family kinase protein
VSKTVIPYSYFVLTWIPGESLLRAVLEMSLDHQKRLFRSLGDMLGKIHAIRSKQPGEIVERNGRFSVVPRRTPYAKLVKSEFEGIFEEMTRSRAPFPKYIEPARAFVRRNLHLLDAKSSTRLIHTDIDASNVIVKDGKLVGLVDLEGSEFGNPEYEIAKSEHRLIEEIVPEPLIPEMKGELFQAYRGRARIPPAYARRKPLLYLMILLDDMCMLPRIRDKMPPNHARILVRDVEHILRTGETRF